MCAVTNCAFAFQLTASFAGRITHKINDLLTAMEKGLKSADPRDCTGYTGWAGKDNSKYRTLALKKFTNKKKKFDFSVFVMIAVYGVLSGFC